ncbi:MAG: hypothetical protein Q9219_005397 [cf. Caloplaca sp. 3 TL-2023]
MKSKSPSLSPPPLKRQRLTSPQAEKRPKPPPPASNILQPQVVSKKRPLTFRIFSWNINGVNPYLDLHRPITSFFPSTTSKPPSNPPFPSLRACLHRWCFPHIICLQEIKIAPSDTSSQAALRRTVNTPLNDDDAATESHRLYDAHFCLPRDRHNATGFGGKVYGVCTLVRRDLISSSVTTTVEWDLEGRVLATELPHQGTVVFNIYAVNGTTNPYRDPSTGKVIGDRHMRKRIFHQELQAECERYEDQGWKVVVAGDLNIARTEMDSFPELRMGKEHVVNRAHFHDCFIERKGKGGLGMRDTFREVKGEEQKYTYRPTETDWDRGMDRVDLILVSEGVVIKDANILDTVLERGRSDHVPLMVKIEAGVESHDQVKMVKYEAAGDDQECEEQA